jgi:iron-sulfur cluster assembly protein
MITLTPRACDAIRGLVPAERRDTDGLRIFVEKGGCSGLSYAMTIAPASPGDHTVESGGVCVFLDAGSARYLKGTVIDYSDSLTNTGFRFQNPNAKQTCGCGTSFEA